MEYRKLKIVDPRFATTPVIVSCAYCDMTMWCNSDNCFVDNSLKQNIICRGCATDNGPNSIRED